MFCFRQANPHNYDAWFDYLRLVENDADADTVREVYERAIANMPPIQEKRHWKRYIYLWINYALYEELEVKVRSSRLVHIFLQSSLFLTPSNANDIIFYTRTVREQGRCIRPVWTSSHIKR